jgi:hypothetical protein
MGARVAEIDEDAVAHVLRDKAVVAPDRGTAAALKRRDDIAQIFGVHPGRECRRSHEVAKHHRQLAALGLRRRGDRGRGGGRPLRGPHRRQWLRQRHGLGSRHTPIGRPNQKLAIDIGRYAQCTDQFAADVFEGLVVEVETSFYPAIGHAALGDEAPEDLFQHPRKVHASALVRCDLRLSGMNLTLGSESPIRRDCFAALAMTNQFCHCEERSDEAISKQRSQKSGLICLVETTSSRMVAIPPNVP